MANEITAEHIPEQTCVNLGNSYSIPSDTPTADVDWLTFDHWEDETGQSYSPGDTISDVDKPKKLTAKWRENFYTLSYNNNGVEANTPSDETQYHYGTEATVKDFTDVPEGYNFLGWAETQNGEVKYQKDQTIVMDSSKILYAKWCANITFDDGLEEWKEHDHE